MPFSVRVDDHVVEGRRVGGERFGGGGVDGDGARWVTVVAASGDVDIETAPELRAAFAEAVRRAADTVVVDLADVGFLDSSGIGALVSLLHAPGNPRVVVVNARPIVRNALRVMGLEEPLSVHAYGSPPPPLPGVTDTRPPPGPAGADATGA